MLRRAKLSQPNPCCATPTRTSLRLAARRAAPDLFTAAVVPLPGERGAHIVITPLLRGTAPLVITATSNGQTAKTTAQVTVACPEHASGITQGQGCECDAGYNGSIATDWYLPGAPQAGGCLDIDEVGALPRRFHGMRCACRSVLPHDAIMR